jgi:hypothetical protein
MKSDWKKNLSVPKNEGSPNGSVNENKFFNNYPDELSENMKYLDVLGGVDTYGHFPTGWAVAFSTPFQMFKRYSEYAGGTCCPLVISWPKGIKAKARAQVSVEPPQLLDLTIQGSIKGVVKVLRRPVLRPKTISKKDRCREQTGTFFRVTSGTAAIRSNFY